MGEGEGRSVLLPRTNLLIRLPQDPGLPGKVRKEGGNREGKGRDPTGL